MKKNNNGTGEKFDLSKRIDEMLKTWQKNIKTTLSAKVTFAKAITITISIFLTIVVFMKNIHTRIPKYEIGAQIIENYYSPAAFSFVNSEKTEDLILDKISETPPVFTVDRTVEDDCVNNLSAVLGFLGRQKEEEKTISARYREFAAAFPGIKIRSSEYGNILKTEDLNDLKNIFWEKIIIPMKRGIMPARAEMERFLVDNHLRTRLVTVRMSDGFERTRHILDINTKEGVIAGIKNSKKEPEYLKTLLIAFAEENVHGNISYDAELTGKRHREIRREMKPIKDVYEKKSLILRKGEFFSENDAALIRTLRNYLSRTLSLLKTLGILLFILLLFLALSIYTNLFNPETFKTNESYFLIALIYILFLGLMSLYDTLEKAYPNFFLTPYTLPFSFLVFVMATFLNDNLSILFSVIVLILASFFYDFNIDIMLYGFVDSLLLLFAMKRRVRRGNLFFMFLVTALLLTLVPLSISLIRLYPVSMFIRYSISIILGHVLSYLLVISIMPVIEGLFDMPTNFALVDLLSGEHELIKNLSLLAPGTYQHSVAVANMAEMASKTINAKSLVAKVGGLFHDIGKIQSPQYFIENQFGDKNPHDKIPPIKSAKILKQHVIYGYQLSLDHMLPKPVRRIILEHHGTALIAHFFEQAQKLAATGAEEPDDSDFRYQGNKPTSKESAIVMFADRVEAQSRLLKSHQYAEIKRMVDNTLTQLLVIENQFSNCDITLDELNKVANSMIKTIQNVYHKRIEYEE